MRVNIRNRHVLGMDALGLFLLPVLEYALRFEGLHWSPADTSTFLVYWALSAPLKLAFLAGVGLYTRLWNQAGFRDFLHVAATAFVSAALCAFVFGLLLPGLGTTPVRVPLSVLVLDSAATFILVCASRATARLFDGPRITPGPDSVDERRTIIAGAGTAGRAVAEELHLHPEWGFRLVGFVDDDLRKQHRLLAGQPVLGAVRDLPALLASQRVAELIIAMPSARGAVIRRVLEAARITGVHTRTVPSLFELISEKVSVTALRKVEIRDLLRREQVETDLSLIRGAVAGRTVLVTGAGGSIGSELCRQLAPLGPRRLLLLGHGENSIYDIHTAMTEAFPGLELVPVIADVRDYRHTLEIFSRYLPDVVFHAAAHKHVPLMETNVAEAILNNVAGTDSLVQASATLGVERFVLISSDKAVRPCSIMGTTKRIAEMLVQDAGTSLGRNFVAVRLGNVLASRGSVIPHFLRQIQAGGPVLVTHPDMQRYFMTIPEAVQLVLQAAALGRNGNVFVLDMGEPVRILDLAAELIRLSGLEPNQDIEIRFTGVRPGERLFEEILFSGESVTPTEYPKVLRATNVHLPGRLRPKVARLLDAAHARQPEHLLRRLMQEITPEALVAAPASPEARESAVKAGTTGHLVSADPDPGV
ncbi:MAG TPA: nucleoside-diphosphate sugar epimerase/dehydratase [Gemmatimonadales bacterium]|nr:nucleoside-diphosphate sugar epimerase/dehydratase [Gemmatimonadales bacterium]